MTRRARRRGAGAVAVLVTAATAAPGVAAAAPVRVAPGVLHALTAHEGSAFAVVDHADAERPLALVRTSGRAAGRRVPFGERGAEFPDVAAGPGGVVLSWGRMASGGERWFAAPADDLAAVQDLGQGTGPGRLALEGDRRLLAGPDAAGDALLVGEAPGGVQTRLRLTDTGPHERHLPLDVAVAGDAPLVLDLGQRPGGSALTVLGERAPREPVVRVGRLQTIRGTLAVRGDVVRVAYLLRGRAFLASARAERGARWRVRRLGGPGGGRGSALVAPGGEVLYTQRGAGGHDVYLADGARVRRLTRTAQDEEEPHLAGDGERLFAGWTRRDRRARRTDAMVLRIR